MCTGAHPTLLPRCSGQDFLGVVGSGWEWLGVVGSGCTSDFEDEFGATVGQVLRCIAPRDQGRTCGACLLLELCARHRAQKVVG